MYYIHESNEQRQRWQRRIDCLQTDLSVSSLIGQMPVNEKNRRFFKVYCEMIRRSITMAGLSCFYPDVYLDSTYEIDFEALYREGFRGVIFDIDNTLVPHGAPADARSIALFERLTNIGFESVLLSNNKEPRVKMFNDKVHSHYIYKAGKPGKRGYLRAMELMKTEPATTLFVGDQLFTDVWGAKRTGILTYLVKPIHPKEEIQIVLKRRLEWIVLFFYRRSLKRQEERDGNKR